VPLKNLIAKRALEPKKVDKQCVRDSECHATLAALNYRVDI